MRGCGGRKKVDGFQAKEQRRVLPFVEEEVKLFVAIRGVCAWERRLLFAAGQVVYTLI